MNQKNNLFRMVAFGLALCFGSVAWGQNAAKTEIKLPQGVEKVTTVEGITEYRLTSNGLRFLLFPDQSKDRKSVV